MFRLILEKKGFVCLRTFLTSKWTIVYFFWVGHYYPAPTGRKEWYPLFLF